MGVSAISSIGRAYGQNQKEVASYSAAIDRGGLATMRGYHLNEDDVLRRTVINRLLCHTLIRKSEIEQEFGINFDDYFGAELAHLEPFVADGLVVLDRDEISVTWLGRIFIRNIAMVFDAYLEKQKLDSRPLFSKTL